MAPPERPPQCVRFGGGSRHCRYPRATKKPAIAGFFVCFCFYLTLRDTAVWSPRQESNLYLALRRRPFYPLNYGEVDSPAF